VIKFSAGKVAQIKGLLALTLLGLLSYSPPGESSALGKCAHPTSRHKCNSQTRIANIAHVSFCRKWTAMVGEGTE
jgi:hypothetical protein